MPDASMLSLVISSALADAFSPATIGILLLIITVVLGRARTIKRLAALGSAYILACFATYFVIGVGLLYFFGSLPVLTTRYITGAVSILVILGGLLEVKEGVWPGVGPTLRMPHQFVGSMHKWAKNNVSLFGALGLGMLAAIITLPSVGAPYIAATNVLHQNLGAQAIGWLLLYNVVFILPLIITLFVALGGIRVSAIHRWREDNKRFVSFIVGLLLLALGWMLILVATQGEVSI